MGLIDKLCRDIFNVALPKDLDSTRRLSIIHINLVIVLENQLECNL